MLAEHDARATFFILGERIEGKEETLARILAEGHEIGNHTFSHPHALNLDDGELSHDIARCNRLLAFADPVLMRPPYGEDPLRVLARRRSTSVCRPRRSGRSTRRTSSRPIRPRSPA